MKSMEDDKVTLLQQLENARDMAGSYSTGAMGDNFPTEDALQMMAKLHDSNLSSLLKNKNRKSTMGRRKGSRPSSARNKHARTVSTSSEFSDVSSVDSEVDLVYVPGTAFRGKEAESMLKRIKEQKKEIKKMSKAAKLQKLQIKKLTLQLQNKEEQFNRQIRKREKQEKQLLEQQQHTMKALSKLRSSHGRHTSQSSISGLDELSSKNQRSQMALRKQVKNLQNEIDTNGDLIANLKERLRRAIANSSKNPGKNTAGGTVSLRKVARLEKDINNARQEIAAKQKKLDEMFLKWKKAQKKAEIAIDTNQETQARMAAFTLRYKDLENRYKLLEVDASERSQSRKDIKKYESQIQALTEKLIRLKSRNKRLSKRVKQLLARLEEYELIQDESARLQALLNKMRNEKHALQLQMASENSNKEALAAKIKQLEKSIELQQFEYEANAERLSSFKHELSAEYTMIRVMQKQLEEKEEQIDNLNMEHLSISQAMESQKEDNTFLEEELNIKILRLEAQVAQQSKVNGRYKISLQQMEAENERSRDKILM
jgi:chromosome segregation ATPase